MENENLMDKLRQLVAQRNEACAIYYEGVERTKQAKTVIKNLTPQITLLQKLINEASNVQKDTGDE